jgi:hypothetical protein
LCRGLAVLVAVGATGCSTTHDLGRLGDPATMAQIDELANQPGTTARVTPLPGRHPLEPKYTVTSATPNGLMVSIGGAPPTALSYDRVQSLTHLDRLHGARNGALGIGIPSFVLGFLVGTAATALPGCCAAPGNPMISGLKVGGASGLIGAALGGALGALMGYRDRYVLSPTETASALGD